MLTATQTSPFCICLNENILNGGGFPIRRKNKSLACASDVCFFNGSRPVFRIILQLHEIMQNNRWHEAQWRAFFFVFGIYRLSWKEIRLCFSQTRAARFSPQDPLVPRWSKSFGSFIWDVSFVTRQDQTHDAWVWGLFLSELQMSLTQSLVFCAWWCLCLPTTGTDLSPPDTSVQNMEQQALRSHCVSSCALWRCLTPSWGKRSSGLTVSFCCFTVSVHQGLWILTWIIAVKTLNVNGESV